MINYGADLVMSRVATDGASRPAKGQAATRHSLDQQGYFMPIKMIPAAAAAIALAFATPAAAQTTARSLVSIYHVAPGQHIAFLKWLDQQDQMSAAAGIAKGQLYVHTDGDSWDYVVIFPVNTEAQDAAFDAVATKMGRNPARAGLELRKYITSHSDTFTRGPMSAGDYLKSMGEK